MFIGRREFHMQCSIDEIRSFAESFYQRYYGKDYHELFPLFHDEIIWSGYHVKESVQGIAQIHTLFQKLTEEQKNVYFELLEITIQVHQFCDTLYQTDSIYKLNVSIDNDSSFVISIFSILTIVANDQLQIRQAFFSLYENTQQASSNMISNLNNLNTMELRDIIIDHVDKLEVANNDMKMLYNSVPGGIFKCMYDENLTLLEMSDGFLSMIGYTRTEVSERLHNSLRKLIDPEDIEEALNYVERQMKISNMKEMNYRLIHKDGHRIHVLDKGQLLIDSHNRPCFHCIVVDVTREKIFEEKLKLSVERYQIIMDQTNDIVFEWDLRLDRLTISNNWEKKFENRYWDNKDGFLSFIEHEQSPFFKEDQVSLVEAVETISTGKETYKEQEVRIKNKEEVFIWCRIRMSAIYDDSHMPVKIIGVLIDIDQEKRHSLTLRQRAEQDALTGMLNKITTQNMIQAYLEDKQTKGAALFIIDIDNFKQINDTYGHLFGDAVLSDIARNIRGTFSNNAIIGRIGGDEFMAFFKDIKDDEDVHQKAETLMNVIQNLQVSTERQVKISCSMGISRYSQDGEDLSSLYQNADYALYQAKKEGKHRYAFYNREKIHQYLENQCAPYTTNINENIDSNKNSKLMKGQFEEYVFEILYHSENVQSAIGTILEIVGLQFNVSRVYIFENSEDDLFCSNTFEWCNQGIEPQIKILQNISYRDSLGDDYKTNFDEARIFYCSDIRKLPERHYKILEPQGIISILQCAICDNGEFRGYVGFDECRQIRYWTQDQINTLVFISEIISTFLLKSRAEEHLRQESECLLSLLDKQNAWIYVIDQETMELLFINKKTKQIAPLTKLGMTCHRAFLNRTTPCENCPIKNFGDTTDKSITEFYNNELNVWSNVEATTINWKGKKAILLTCHDITKYKQS